MKTTYKAAKRDSSIVSVSLIISVVFLVIGILIVYVIHNQLSENQHLGISFIIAISFLLLPAILIGAYLFSVKEYILDDEGTELIINRIINSKNISIDNLSEVRCLDSNDTKGMIHILGNGGLFTYAGIFKSPALGTFNMYSSNKNKYVLIRTPKISIMISPEDPEVFLNNVNSIKEKDGKNIPASAV